MFSIYYQWGVPLWCSAGCLTVSLSHLRVSNWTCHKVLFPSVVLVFSNFFTLFYYFALYLIKKKYLSLFSWVAEIFSKWYKNSYSWNFSCAAISLCPQQSRAELNTTTQLSSWWNWRIFPYRMLGGHVLSVCLSICLFSLSELEIILLNKILRNINWVL